MAGHITLHISDMPGGAGNFYGDASTSAHTGNPGPYDNTVAGVGPPPGVRFWVDYNCLDRDAPYFGCKISFNKLFETGGGAASVGGVTDVNIYITEPIPGFGLVTPVIPFV